MSQQPDTRQAFVLIVSFMFLALAYLPLHAFAALIVPATQEFGSGRGNAAIVVSLYWIVRAVTAPVMGMATEHIGAIRLQIIGGLTLAVALITASRTTSLPGLYTTYGLGVALSSGAMADVPTFALLRSWFSRRLGAALGIASIGMGAGLIVMPLITVTVDTLGWRETIFRLGLAVLILVSITSVVGILLARRSTRESSSYASRRLDISPRQALTSRSFWLLLAAVVLAPFTYHLALIHQIAYLGDFGYPPLQAGAAVASMGLAAVAGRFAAGALSDNFGRTRTYAACAILVAGSYIIMALSRGSSTIVILVYTICLGIGYGGFAPLFPAVSSDLFGGKHYATIHSWLYVGVALGGALGTWIPGKIYDVTNSYHQAFIISIITISLSAWLFDRAHKDHVKPLVFGA